MQFLHHCFISNHKIYTEGHITLSLCSLHANIISSDYLKTHIQRDPIINDNFPTSKTLLTFINHIQTINANNNTLYRIRNPQNKISCLRIQAKISLLTVLTTVANYYILSKMYLLKIAYIYIYQLLYIFLLNTKGIFQNKNTLKKTL